MPAVRECVAAQLELLATADPRAKEDAVHLLRAVARACGALVEAYVPTVAAHLVQQLLSPHAPPNLARAAMAAVGELSLVTQIYFKTKTNNNNNRRSRARGARDALSP
jgi:hypothetical protein